MSAKMDKTVDKCLEFCKTLAMSNHKFSFHISIGNDRFNFSNKEQVQSSWQKKKSPSQVRREMRRKEDHQRQKATEKVTDNDDKQSNLNKVTEKVTDANVTHTCDQCEFESISDRGLRQHIRKKHQIAQVDGAFDTELEKHLNKNNDKIPEKEDKIEKANSEHNKCPICDENYKNKNDLEKHMNWYHGA